MAVEAPEKPTQTKKEPAEEKPKEEKSEELKKEPEEKEIFPATGEGRPDLLGPEGVLMLFIAFGFDSVDVAGLILKFFGYAPGEIFNLVVDSSALVVIGSWMFFRSGRIPIRKRLLRVIFRGGVAFVIVERIPIVDVVAFSWVILVYLQCKKPLESPKLNE